VGKNVVRPKKRGIRKKVPQKKKTLSQVDETEDCSNKKKKKKKKKTNGEGDQPPPRGTCAKTNSKGGCAAKTRKSPPRRVIELDETRSARNMLEKQGKKKLGEAAGMALSRGGVGIKYYRWTFGFVYEW